MTNSEQISAPRILRIDEVLARTSISKSTLYNFIAAGTFPAPVRLGPRRVGWNSRSVDAWIESRAATTEPEQAAA